MKDLLLSKTTEFNKRLNSCGDRIVNLHRNGNCDKTILLFIDKQFDNMQELLGNLDVAILNCYDDRDLLISLIPYINETSFMIASLIGKVMEIEEVLQW